MTSRNEIQPEVEAIASEILDMMAEKTVLYGGMNTRKGDPLSVRILQLHYEGINRKANRLPSLIKLISKEPVDPVALEQYIDTVKDIIGYGLLTLKEIHDEN